MDAAVRQLLIELLASWRDWPERRAWYLAEHIPKVIFAGPDAGRNLDERVNLELIRTHLDGEEWEALGMLAVQVEKRDQGVIAEFRARANRARALAAEADQKARSAEKRRQREAEEDDRQARRAERVREREGQLAAERAAAMAERKRLAAVETAKREERALIEHEMATEKSVLLSLLAVELELRFLDASEWLKINDPDGLIADHEFQNAAVKHVMEWCRSNLTLANGMPFVPDSEQAAAVAIAQQHALISARAGSGKTATMVARSVSSSRHAGLIQSRS